MAKVVKPGITINHGVKIFKSGKPIPKELEKRYDKYLIEENASTPKKENVTPPKENKDGEK